jgi:hypothetical protein
MVMGFEVGGNDLGKGGGTGRKEDEDSNGEGSNKEASVLILQTAAPAFRTTRTMLLSLDRQMLKSTD